MRAALTAEPRVGAGRAEARGAAGWTGLRGGAGGWGRATRWVLAGLGRGPSAPAGGRDWRWRGAASGGHLAGSARPVPPPPLPRRAACHAVTRSRLPSPALRNLGVSGYLKKKKKRGNQQRRLAYRESGQ